MTRFLHITDIHLEPGFREVPKRAFLNKRITGYASLALRRRAHFAGADEKIGLLAELADRSAIDHVLCTGDYTALGTVAELEHAQRITAPLFARPLGFSTVPGNHDVYVDDTVGDGAFVEAFGAGLESAEPVAAEGSRFPYVRYVGEDVAVLAVNSAKPNPSVFDSSGWVPEAELEALARTLTLPEVRRRFCFVLTHYAPFRADGTPDKRQHGLHNADALLDVLRGMRRGALLHGHVHYRYHHPASHAGVPIFCAGSSTYVGREGIWRFDIDGDDAIATPGGFSGGDYGFDDADAVSF